MFLKHFLQFLLLAFTLVQSAPAGQSANSAQSVHRAKRAMPLHPQRTLYNRNLRAQKEEAFDPALKGLSLPELYRMLEVIDMMEAKKTSRVSNKEMDTLNYLLNAYDQ